MDSMKRLVVLTGSELRHSYFRKALALSSCEIKILRSFCEVTSNSLRRFIDPEKPGSNLSENHVKWRELSEGDFFGPFVNYAPDLSNPVFIEKGSLNSIQCLEEIHSLQPDLIVAYGCSLIKPPLLSAFRNRFINLHLGLSPYYRGAGTNFWPLVYEQPEFVGVTYMHIDEGVDTGEIIHQIRARIFEHDTPHQIGNRLISDMVTPCMVLINNFENLQKPHKIKTDFKEKVCRQKDFNPEAVETLYRVFREGLVEKFLSVAASRYRQFPIVRNSLFSSLEGI